MDKIKSTPIIITKNRDGIICSGDWTLHTLKDLQAQINALNQVINNDITINGKDIKHLDSAGAWLLISFQKKLATKSKILTFVHFSDEHNKLLTLIAKNLAVDITIAKPNMMSVLTKTGHQAVDQLKELLNYFRFVGYVSYELLRILRSTARIRWQAYIGTVYRDGYQALAIIALLSFMIGVVTTYQMGLQLRNYGANIFIVDLLGLAILREFGPLLTAIMVAGRTGSAFTAQIGSMKINQEIDALNTLGITPAELLLIPRIIGLFIALPLLTIWSDIFGIIGGMVMSNNMLGITWYDFLHRFPHVIKLKNLLIGLGKAPVFALIIASIGCFKGMQVTQGADSLGSNTTRSVVLSIFFIIVADALFSIFFSQLKL